uniref:Predicted protein n=1 Tax=Hordeum vulgare subsp. vulgare TaxID=112509 RepID=F2D1C1_HORVV|nr:predicted protein [Hordeum vulgare subsp. vulgare]
MSAYDSRSRGSRDYHRGEIFCPDQPSPMIAMSVGAANLLGGHNHGAGPVELRGNLRVGLPNRTVVVCGVFYLLGGTILELRSIGVILEV